MYPKPAKDASQESLGDHPVGGEAKDAQIPELWRMSALSKICWKDVKEQMMMRLDEQKSHDQQARGGQKDVCSWQRAGKGRLGG